MRFIDADALCEDLMRRWSVAETRKEELIKSVMADIVTPIVVSQPTIEPERHGRWIHIRTEPDGNALYECSECHKGDVHVPIVEVHYCWNCGAKMEGEQDGD